MEETNTASVVPKSKQKNTVGNISFLGGINSTTVHIVVEAVVFAFLYFHFNAKISNLVKENEMLKEELEDQAQTIQRHEDILRKLVDHMQASSKQPQVCGVQTRVQPQVQTQVQPQVQTQVQPQVQTQVQPQVQFPPLPQTRVQPQPQVQTRAQAEPENRYVAEDNQITPSITELKPQDLDAELQEELSEMNRSVVSS